MKEFTDDIVGRVQVRRHHNSRHIRFRLSPRRELIATVPPRTPLIAIKAAVRASRKNIKRLVDDQEHQVSYHSQQKIGQSHKLIFIESAASSKPTSKRQGTLITVHLPTDMTTDHPDAQAAAQTMAIKALDRESRAYLPRRLSTLAMRHGHSYMRVRYTHTTSRWGSCSSNGTISLNIALMKLPIDLIDYVLVHELCHTKQMNHSKDFWDLVHQADPHWRDHRRQIKTYSPLL